VPHATEPAVAIERVSTLELFFDLVFVFTVTQIARLVSGAHGSGDLGTAALILTIVWWMYAGFAWLTSNVAADTLHTRLLMLTGMCAYFVMALSIPRAVGQDGLVFGVSFTLVTLVHGVLFTRATNSSARAILLIAPYNLSAAGCTIVAGLLDPSYRWIGWLAAVVIFLSVTAVGRERGFHISPAHFAERHGLVIIVAIGESIVSLGSGIDTVPVRWSLITIVTLGFALCAALWWTYFDGDDLRGEHALRKVSGFERGRLAMLAYSYGHLGMVAGIVAIAAGLHDAIAAGGGPVAPSHAWVLSAGVAIYLLSDKWFRYLLSIGPSYLRSAGALLALLAAPVGARWATAGQIAMLVVILIFMLVGEQHLSRRKAVSFVPADR